MRKHLSHLLLISAICLLPYTGNTQNAFWTHVYPDLPRETLNDAYFLDDNNGLIVGEGGAVIRTTDGGSNWSLLKYATFSTLTRISFADSTTGYIIGEHGTVLKSTDGGYRWAKMPFSDSVSLLSLHFLDKDTGFVTADSVIYKTINGGSSWTKQVVKSGQHTVKKVIYVQFFGNDTGFAYYQPFKPNQQTIVQGALMVTYNGGNTWTHKPVQNKNFFTVSMYNKNIGWAIGDSGDFDNYYKTVNGGTTWTRQITVDNEWPVARQLFVLDSNNVYVLNRGPGHPMYCTNNGGSSWYVKYPATSWPTSVTFLTPQVGFVTDIWGGIYKTVNGGNNWTVESDDANNVASQLRKMYFADSMYGWAGGARRVARTRDGGKTWTVSPILPNSQFLERITFPDTTHVWISTDGGHIYKSTNGGSTWSYYSSNQKAMDVQFYDTTFGMIARKEGKIDITHNGGNSWTTYNFNTQNDVTRVSCVDSLNWYAVVSSTLYKSNDAGNSWIAAKNNLTSIVDFEHFDTSLSYISRLSNVAKVRNNGSTWPSGSTYLVSNPEISFSDSMNGAATKSMWYGNSYKYPNIFVTKDGMNSWQRMAINSNSSALDIFFADTNNIWVGTNYGSIYHYDPDNAFDSTLRPFINADVVVACKSDTAKTVITNYHTYGAADTIKAKLKQGTTVLQNITVTSDTISFPTPSTLGNYTLDIIITNPTHPEGLVTTVPVQIASSYTPVFNYTLNTGNPHCSTDTVIVSFTSGSALGKGFSYELHRLDKNKDTIISVNQQVSRILTADTFSVYYKVYLGTGICQPFPFYHTDTTTVNVIVPKLVKGTIATNKTGNFVCMGDSISLMVAANNIGTVGQNYEFHKLSAGNPDSLVGFNTTGRLHIDTLTDTAYYFCKVFPGTNSCAIQDTVHTDTIMVYAKPVITSVTSSIIADNDTICAGDTLLFSAATVPASHHDRYDFYVGNGSSATLAQSGASDTFRSGAINHNDAVYCFIRIDSLGCFTDTTALTDTAIINVNPAPAQLTIIKVHKDTLSVQGIAGGVYSWYYNGNLVPNADSNVLAPDSTGNYSVTVTVNGCTSPSSAVVYFEKTVDVITVQSKSAYNIVMTPNPTTGVINIHVGNYPAKIYIYKINGQGILNTSIDKSDFSINMGNYPKGIYLVRVVTIYGTFTDKLILQ